MFSWLEECEIHDDEYKKDECHWEPIQVGIDLKVETHHATLKTYLFESDVPYNTEFTVKFGGGEPTFWAYAVPR